MSLVDASRSGDRLAALRSTRDILAGRIAAEETEDKDVAALTGRFLMVLAEIAELEPKKAVGDGIDALAERRSARRTRPAKGSGNAKRSG